MSYHHANSASSASQQGAYYTATSGQYPQYSQGGSAQGYTTAYQSQSGYGQQASTTQYAQYPASHQNSSSSSKKSKDKKSSSSRKQQACLLEVEKQWAAAYEHQQQNSQSYAHGYNQYSASTSGLEPNFTAFTLAGGKSYLEDGSPSPMSSNGRSSGSGNGY